MFQTEPILWLQSVGSPPLTWLLSAVTLLGYTPVYIVLLLVLAFAVRLRPSLAVLGGVLLAGMMTEYVKDAVAYPRPDEVDNRIPATFATTPIELSRRGGGPSFWALPSQEAIETVRRRATGNYGFPSGHVAASTTFFLTTAFFFRSRRLLAFAGFWVPLMALSRLYLGRHFLADVLGGLAIGLVCTGLAVLLFRALDEEVFRRRDRRARVAMVPVTLLSLALLIVTPYERLLEPLYVGGLVGLVISYEFLLATGLPIDGGTVRQRFLRTVLGGLVFLAAGAAGEALVSALGRGSRMAPLGETVLVSTAMFVGTVSLSRSLGLYPGPADGGRASPTRG